MANYKEMDRKELIESLKDLINKGTFEESDKNSLDNLIDYLNTIRAFTYEDRMKLEMIKVAPFSMLTYTKDGIVKLWEGNANKIYKQEKHNMIGKDYIKIIVNEFERRKAYIDCKDIIEHNQEMNVYANDNDRDGVPIKILTCCYPIKDVDSSEKLIAEFGTVVDKIPPIGKTTKDAIKIEKRIANILDNISNLKKTIEIKKHATTSTKKRKLDTYLTEIDNSINDFNNFEKTCDKWADYITQVEDLELKLKTINNNVQSIDNDSNKRNKKTDGGSKKENKQKPQPQGF